MAEDSGKFETVEHFQKLAQNFNELLAFCKEQAEKNNAIFSTPTVLRKDFQYSRKGGKKEFAMFKLENPSIGEDDIFIANFQKIKRDRRVSVSTKISPILLMENYPSALQKIRGCLDDLKAECGRI